jgi:acetyltransferase
VFPIDPDRDPTAAMRTAHDLLERGSSVVWFPEGWRSPTGELQSFQTGVGVLLKGGAVTAIPTAIHGAFAAWPRHERWPRFAPVRVTFGAPQRFAAGESPEAIRDALERAVRRLLAAGASPSGQTEPATPTRSTTMPTESVTATLHDGRKVVIRPIRPDDVTRNAAFLAALSPASRHYLFLGGITHLSDAALKKLCDPDYAHDMAYVALAADGGPPGQERQVGVCRYAGADSENGAEISVAVADDWQHQGLAQLLLRQLIEYARAHGVRRLYSMDAAGNERMRRLAHKAGFAEEADPDDIHQVIYSLQV